MSLKGQAMTSKVLRGKITNIHQIEEVEALYAEAEELIAKVKSVDAEYDSVVAKCDETIDKIEQKGEEVIASIPQEYTALDAQCRRNTANIERNTARIDKNEKRITNIEQGIIPSPFVTDDGVAYQKDVPINALPYAEVEKIGGMTCKCTNLISFPYIYNHEYAYAGVLWTNNNDGSITLNGTATEIIYFPLANVKYKAGQDYYLSGFPKLNIPGTYLYDDRNIQIDAGEGAQYRFDEPKEGKIYIRVASGSTFNNVTIRPMLNEGTTAQPFEKYFEGLRSASVTEVESVGANLFDISKALPIGSEILTVVDASLTIQNTGALYGFYDNNIKYTVGSTYTFSVGDVSTLGSAWGWRIGYKDGTVSGANYSKKLTITVEKDIKWAGFYVGFGETDTPTVTVSQIQIVKGDSADKYIPYVRNTLPIPSAVQALDGYGWGINESVYNYIDWEKKQFVQNVYRFKLVSGVGSYSNDPAEKVVFYRLPYTSIYGAKILCSHFDGLVTNGSATAIRIGGFSSIEEFNSFVDGNDVYVVYELAEPIITDISDILPEDNFIGVEGGGTITMVNEHQYAVPSSIVYQTKEGA